MRRRLNTPWGEYELVSGEDELEAEDELLPAEEARTLLSSWSRDLENLLIFRKLVGGQDPRGGHPADNARVLRHLGREISDDRLRLVRRREVPVVFPAEAPSEAPEEVPELAAPDTVLRDLTIRLSIDPNEAEDDVFVLSSTDGSYRSEKSAKDDQTPGDAFLDLVYEDLDEALMYTLEHFTEPGAKPRIIFESKPFWEISGTPKKTPKGKKKKK